MLPNKKQHTLEKTELHPKNKHRSRYRFKELIKSSPELAPFVKPNKYEDLSIDFFNPKAVKQLNKALLKHHYKVKSWDIPEGYLCPPIPGRADYIHHVADLITKKDHVTCLDVGTGANCIYPIIGVIEYNWNFIASDIDSKSIKNAKQIVEQNENLHNKIHPRLQHNTNNFFKGILKEDEVIDITVCNPPFHSSLKEAQAGTNRKLKNLKQKKTLKPVLNFGGKSNELWCKGGEATFVENMIKESKSYSKQCKWFTSLVSKSAHLKSIYKTLEEVDAKLVKTIPMGQGNKISRIVAWTFQEQ